jgi:hypothetical protein
MQGILAVPLSPRNISLRHHQSGCAVPKSKITTALIDLAEAPEKSCWFSNLNTADFSSHAQAVGP